MALLNRLRGCRWWPGPEGLRLGWFSLSFSYLVIGLAVFGCDDGTRRYTVRGTVHDVQVERRQVLIEHEDIPGLMPAMTMSFDVSTAELAERLRSGQVIEFELVFDGHSYVVNDFEVAGEVPEEEGWVRFGDALLRSDPAPDFELTDQAGRRVSLSGLSGQVLLVDFIFTTCPGPCPILTSSHVRVQQLLPEEVRGRVRLVSITVDPEHDTPDVLQRYGDARGVRFDDWSFLTGAPEDIDPVLQGFGVGRTRDADGLIEHTVISYLVDGQGRIVKRYFGLQHEPRQLAEDLVTLVRSAALPNTADAIE